MTKRPFFDLPVDAAADGWVTMEELLRRHRAAVAARQWEEARRILAYAAGCGHDPARVLLARFYRDTPQLAMSRRERYARAEGLYRRLLNRLDLPEAGEAQLSMELAELYGRERPIACLAWLLRARRLGLAVPEEQVAGCRQQLMGMDVNFLGEDPENAYHLGTELYLAGGSAALAEVFLREACDAGDERLSGFACLQLSQLYRENSEGIPNHLREAASYGRLAARKGFPDLLQPEKNKKGEKVCA